MNKLFIEKYKPEDLEDFVGNQSIVKDCIEWADKWNKNVKGKPLFFYGPTGTGKTLLSMLIAKKFNWSLFELNASDFRNKEQIEKLAGTASQNASFNAGKRLILIDEVDSLSRVDRGGLNAIIKIVKETRNPLILTANDVYASKKFYPLRSLTELIQFKKVNYITLANYLKKICRMEGIEAEDEAIKKIAKECSGDIRSAVLDLQNSVLNKKLSLNSIEFLALRERKENIFNVLKKLFKAKTFNEARNIVIESHFDSEMLSSWIEENISQVFDSEDFERAFNYISKADVFKGRIMKRQYYGFMRYSNDLGITGAVVSKEKEYSKWIKFRFPSIIKKLSSSMKNRHLRKSIALKIGKKVHLSSKRVMQNEIYLFNILFNKEEQAVKLTAEFGFNEEEVNFLLRRKTASKKAEKIVEEAEKLKETNIIEKIKKTKTEEKIETKDLGRQARLF